MSPLARQITDALRRQPKQFSEVADDHTGVPWPQFLRAWGEIRRAEILQRDDDGNYFIGDREADSKPA